MITISENQALERWDLLPDNLKEALYAEANSDFIWQVAQNENIPEERIYTVSKVAGFVLMGFLHPEDVAQELKERLNLDPKTSADLQDALGKRIFAPLRSDIDKVYAPLSKVEMRPSSGPVIMSDIGATPRQVSIPTNVATSQTINSAPSVKTTAIANNNIVPSVQKTNRLSDIGWSRSETSTPVVKLDITQPSMGAPKPPVAAAGPLQQQPPSLTSSAAPTGTFGEFERLSAMKRGPASSSAPTPGATATPAPFILHEDTSFTAAAKNSDFKLSQPQANADMHLGSVKPATMAKPAVLEFGGQASKPPVTSAPSKSAVHYTEFQSTLSKVPTQNSGARQVSQIMPPVPQAPTPAPAMAARPAGMASAAAAIPVPRPPMPPSMPSASPATPAPQAQAPQTQEKVIVKDFL